MAVKEAPTFEGVVNDLFPTPAPDPAAAPEKPKLTDVFQSVAHLPSPDTSAKVFGLANQTGQDPQFVSESIPDFERAVSVPTHDEFEVVQNHFPVTADALRSRKTMAVAYDDVQNMAAHEHINKELTRAHGIADAITAGLQNSILGMEFRGATPDIAVPEEAPFHEKFLSQAAQFGADYPYMVAGGLLGAAVAAPAGPLMSGLAGAGGAFALPDALRATLRQHYESGDHESAADLLKQAFTITTLKAGVKGFGIGLLTGGAGAAAAPFGKLAAGAAEIGTMTTAGALAEGKDIKAEDVASNALLVGLLHGSGALGGYGLDRMFPKRVAETIKLEATKDAATMLDEKSRASKWRTRDPEGFTEFMNSGKPVRIPVVAYESYFQSKGIDPEKVSNDLGVAASHNEARQTNGDVVIPQGKYLGKEMDAHRAGLVDDVKFDAADMTAKEIAESDKLVKERIAQVSADSDAAIKAEPARQDSFDSVAEQHEALLLNAGVPDKEAKANAKIVAAHYTTEAARREQGQTAQQLYDSEVASVRRGIGDYSAESLNQPVFHGSPHEFDEFKLNKIGTGEGAQAFGWGLYFSSEKKVAQNYRENLSNDSSVPQDLEMRNPTTGTWINVGRGSKPAEGIHLEMVHAAQLAYYDGVRNARTWAKRWLKEAEGEEGPTAAVSRSEGRGPEYYKTMLGYLENMKTSDVRGLPKGRLYHVDIPDDETMLHWDKELSDQPEAVKAAIQRAGLDKEFNERKAPIGPRDEAGAGRGENFYMFMANKLSSMQNQTTFDGVIKKMKPDEKAASLALLDIGINGIKYKADQIAGAGHKGFNYVVFDDKLAKITKFEQDARGEYTPALNEIKLGNDADASTYMHEFFHGALHHMFEFVKSGDATQEYLDHFKALYDFLDIKPEQEKLTTEQQEKGARAFERYLRGDEDATKAPSDELRGAFAQFRRWLTQVYRQIKGSPIEGELTPEAHDFFDRMLATEDQIEAAQRETGYQPSEIQDLPDADPAMQNRVRTLQQRAHDEAVDVLLKEQMAELSAENRATLDKERERLTAREAPLVSDQPLYLAAQDVEENRPGPRKSAATLADEFLSGKLSDQEASSFEAAAEVHGFADGTDLAQSLKADSEAGGIEGTVKQRVDRGMKAFADLKDTEKLKARALEIIHSDRTTELMALEGHILEDLQRKKEVSQEIAARRKTAASAEAKAVKAQARALLASKPIDEAGAFRPYFTAERKAAVRVSEALRSGDYAAAAKAKREQMMNHALATEALRNKTEIARDGKFLRKFIKRGPDMLNMPQGFIGKIDDLLETRGLKGPRDVAQDQTLVRIADEMLANKSTPSEIANATGYVQGDNGWQRETLPAFVARINDENYVALSLPDSVMRADSLKQAAQPKMTMADLRDLKTAIKMLNYVGTQFERFLSDFIKGDLKTNASELRKSIEQNIGTPHGDVPAFGSLDLSNLQKAVDLIKSQPDGMIASKVNLLTLCEYLDKLDPNGPAKNNIYRPLRESTNNEKVMRADAAERLEKIRQEHYSKEDLAKMDESISTWEANGRKVRLTRENAIVLLLNRGSESNMDRLRNGFGLTDEQIREKTDLLDKKDHEFAQDVWKFVDSFWPQAAALEMKVNGIEPKKVKATPVESRHGIYSGGYYPLSYDFEKSADAYKNAEERNALFKQYSTAAAHTEQGSLKERVKTLSRPVRLTFDGLFNHLDDVIHDITFRPAVIDVARFLNMPEAKTAIVNAIGIDGYKKIGEDLKAAASSQAEFLTPMDKKLRWFRFGTTMATLGYRFAIFPRRISEDVMNSMREVGFRNTIGGIADFAKERGDMIDFNRSKSVVMRDRAVSRERDLIQMAKQWKGKDSWIKRYAFMQDTLADQALSHPVWNAVYKNNLEKYGEPMAVRLADEAILKTFGGGDEIDRVGAQRGGELNRLVSMYYSWHSMMFNRAWLQGKIAGLEYNDGNYGKATAIIASTVATSWVIPAAIDVFWKELFRNAPEGEDEEHKKKRMAAAALEAPFAYFPLARNIAAYGIPKLLGEHGRAYKMSPAEDAIENITKTVADGVRTPFDPNKEYDQKFAEEAMRSAAILIGSPSQLNTWTFNFVDWLNGEGEANWRDLLSRRLKK